MIFLCESEVLCKNEYDWRRDMIVPEEDEYSYPERKPIRRETEEPRADLITIHIYKDQIVRMTEDVIRWMFHKVKGIFRRKRKQKKERDVENKKYRK